MNHKWIKNKEFKPHDYITEEYFCTTCGCRKFLVYYDKGRAEFDYERSGIMFFNKRPDCIDWNDNNLD